MTILKSKLDVLIAARELIADEGRWTQGVMARDMTGCSTFVDDPLAACFCSVGAVERVSPSSHEAYHAAQELWNTVKRSSPSLATYNDTHSHAEVLAVWDETIRRVSEEGKA